jgi:hypothetical protein
MRQPVRYLKQGRHTSELFAGVSDGDLLQLLEAIEYYCA